jgi:hypothetical protein
MLQKITCIYPGLKLREYSGPHTIYTLIPLFKEKRQFTTPYGGIYRHLDLTAPFVSSQTDYPVIEKDIFSTVYIFY